MAEFDDRIDALPLSPYHLWIFTIGFVIVLLDGFDGSSLAFAAPALSAELGFATTSLGPIFSAHLVGMVVGSAVLGSALGSAPKELSLEKRSVSGFTGIF